MTCKKCGAEIQEGLDYCMECGESTEERIVITSRKLPVEAQPFLDFSGYVKSLSSNLYNVMALIGAICLYLSPFFRWMSKMAYDEKISANLFDIGSDTGDLALNQANITLMAMVIVIMGIYMLAMSAREYLRPVKNYADNLIVRIIPIIVSIVVFVLILVNKEFSNATKLYNVELYKCLGPIFLVVGIVIYSLSVIMEIMQSRENS